MISYYLISIFVFIFGLVIGSFLNVVIYRYNTGVGVGGRSGCLSCGKTLSWYELFPVASFLAQKGKCRKCKTKLSWQYPLVELFTGFIFLSVLAKLAGEGFSVLNIISEGLALVGWCLLIAIAVYDWKHKIIPDGLAYTFAVVGFIRIFTMIPIYSQIGAYSFILAGPVLFLPFLLLWLVSKGKWIGLGDGKLALGIGFMLGLGYGISAVVLAFWIGAAVSIIALLVSNIRLKSKASGLTMKSEIPFAPFLILGFAIDYFLNIDVMGIHTILRL